MSAKLHLVRESPNGGWTYESHTLKTLKDMARARSAVYGVRGYSTLKKAALIDLLRKHDKELAAASGDLRRGEGGGGRDPAGNKMSTPGMQRTDTLEEASQQEQDAAWLLSPAGMAMPKGGIRSIAAHIKNLSEQIAEIKTVHTKKDKGRDFETMESMLYDLLQTVKKVHEIVIEEVTK